MKNRKHILVVEDDPDIREIIADFLADEGFWVICKGTGTEALETLKQSPVNLTILDMGLPDMNGNDFLRELTRYSLEVPVVVVSANTRLLQPHPQVKAVIPKPFDLHNLLTTIQENA